MKFRISILIVSILLSVMSRLLAQDIVHSVCTGSISHFVPVPDSTPGYDAFHYRWVFSNQDYFDGDPKYFGVNNDSIEIKWSSEPTDDSIRVGYIQTSKISGTDIGCDADITWSPYFTISGVDMSIISDHDNKYVCAGDLVTFTQTEPVESLYWNDDSTLTGNTFTYQTTKAEKIVFRVTGSKNDNSCSTTDSTELVVMPIPEVNITVDDLDTNSFTLCKANIKARLYAGPVENRFYTWETNDTRDNFLTNNEILVGAINPDSSAKSYYYRVTVEDQHGCSASDTVVLNSCIESLDHRIPMAITPEGKNSTWNMPFLDYYDDAQIDVYDRWGNNVFRSRGHYKAWDGTSSGVKLPLGTYYYIIKTSKKADPIYGNVLILR